MKNILNEDKKLPIKVTTVSFGLNDERSGIDADEYLEKKKKVFIII